MDGVAIVMLVHPTKAGAQSGSIDASKYLKDSVTFGGKFDVGCAFAKVDHTSQVFIKRIKGRGFKSPLSFTITVNDSDGNSWLDRGRFPVCVPPSEGSELRGHALVKSKGGAPKMQVDIQRMRGLFEEGKTNEQVANELQVSVPTVKRHKNPEF